MRITRGLSFTLVLAFLATSIATAQKKPLQPGEVLLIGKLTQVMGIGGETTGWSLELKSETTREGQTVHAIEVSGPRKRLTKFESQDVRARGFVKHRHGVERKDWLVLEISSIRPLNPPKPTT